ncbi:MAG TPA: hypothetical protein PKV71_04125 [Calditrichia bacterium]|nr:hypothetical protein [Calditrichota bacterium]HQU73410.1 hypothetical protein [Calditrichia bacterium]HQV31035.1 hypothetical protein [Calditrichia bacterium]
MKKFTMVFAMILALAAANQTLAREISGYGARGMVAMSSGGYGNFWGNGAGGVGTVFYKFDDKITLSGSVGFLRHSATDNLFGDLSLTVIPIMSGARYYLKEEGEKMRPYVGGDLGYFFVSVGGDDFGYLGSGSSEITLGPAAGVNFGKLDLRAVYYLTDISYLGLEVGIALWN